MCSKHTAPYTKYNSLMSASSCTRRYVSKQTVPHTNYNRIVLILYQAQHAICPPVSKPYSHCMLHTKYNRHTLCQAQRARLFRKQTAPLIYKEHNRRIYIQLSGPPSAVPRGRAGSTGVWVSSRWRDARERRRAGRCQETAVRRVFGRGTRSLLFPILNPLLGRLVWTTAAAAVWLLFVVVGIRYYKQAFVGRGGWNCTI